MNDKSKLKKMVNKDSEKVGEEANIHTKSDHKVLTQELETCMATAAEWQDKFVLVSADFENYKKRVMQEQKNWIATAQADILSDLLTIVDNFERALKEQEKQEFSKELHVWLQGISMIYQLLQKLLEKSDVEKITQDDTFNPIYHEAVMQVDAPEHESGTIVEVLQKGYLFKGKVLRPAKVSVAK